MHMFLSVCVCVCGQIRKEEECGEKEDSQGEEERDGSDSEKIEGTWKTKEIVCGHLSVCHHFVWQREIRKALSGADHTLV